MSSNLQPVEQDVDVLVIGGGIVGLSATWLLAEEGVGVLCLDAGDDSGSAANAGSLHGQMQSRMERQFPERVRDYLRMLPTYPRAIDYWGEIAGRLGQHIEYRVTGGLMIAESRDDMAALAAKSSLERQHGIETELLGRDELLHLSPGLNPTVQGALYCAKEGKINPLPATAAMCDKAVGAGALVRPGTRVLELEQARPGFLATTDRGAIRAGRVLIAAGAGSGRLAASLGLDLPCRAELLQMCITEPAEPLMNHLIQHAAQAITIKQLDTGQVLIGGGWPAARERDDLPPVVLAQSLAGNLNLARRLVPELGNLRLQRTWAGVNTLVDLVSVLGPVESMPGLYFAVPGDAGFTLGPYCARLVVDAMLGRSPDYPLDPFSPARFQ
ncbi:MAG: FAD-binding oxidoreductase [Gammaproteobacteria bacterium]|nr:FAD-binding oxidoreductase [Gammaproteobacteria bacterium]MDE0366483.1 FAD-binding oxidoreductase [Gammaproteobacteria bacterium]